jgi:hypothetical protein
MPLNYAQIEPQIREALYSVLGPHIAIGTEESPEFCTTLNAYQRKKFGVQAEARGELPD